ncbi:MAG: extracellular solute-binding protein [Spirochaetaceae bacterium]|jgi:multiple sugar transport system substrate-binding protein|nr:extracellular solute-binding protein [Spirochaetaceae bacterium]
MKTIKTVFWLSLILLVCAAPAFAGGGSQSQAGSGGSKELNVVYSGTSQVAEREYLIDVFVKKFETQYGVKVNVEFITQADTIRKIESEQDTKNIVSDIVYADTANMAPYVNGGWMEDISGFIHSGITLTKMYDETTNKGGVRYFVPGFFDVYLLAANVDALKYLPSGLTRQNVIDGITWEQYVQWAINIARGEGVGKTMMPANNQGSQLLYPMAGMGLAYGGGFPDFTSDGFKKALELIAALAAGNAFYPEQAQYTAPTDPMQSGGVWLTFAHMGPVGVAYNAAPNEWVIGAAPKGSKGAGSTSGAWCWGIQKGAPHKDLAQKWIDFVTTPQNNYDFCINNGGVLSPINEVGPLLGNQDVIMAAGNKMLGSTIVSGVPSTQYTDWNAVKLLYHDAFNQAVNTKAVPSDAFLRDLDAKCKALLN